MTSEIKIGIGNEGETAQEFVEVWRRAERGTPPEVPMEHLYFPDLETLLRTLTSQRLALLKTLYTIGPISIRALAKALGRDYKNVHTDVQALQHVGLVTRQRDGRLLVPWTRIVAELRLAA
jgi:predicted transcriptional regulator